MCGIVGLHFKSPELHSQLGELLGQMLLAMSERGPDSAGIALYEEGLPDGEPALLTASARARLRLGGHERTAWRGSRDPSRG